jgi:aromatic-L-amino-acid decarboxylase
VETYPVLSQVKPGDIRARLPEHPPTHAEPFEAVFADFERHILPGVTHWQSPKFFGYFPSNNSFPSILGELLSAGLGVQGMLWATSPACTELETLMLDWLVELLGLPARFRSTSAGGGVIQDTASNATLCALLAARERATGFRSNEEGLSGGLTAYTSSQAHSSLPKAARIAGLGRTNLRQLDVDERFALRPDALEDAIRADLAAGRRPFFAMATVGTTSSTALDPLRPIGEICRRHGLWLHVDAAMSGSAAVCPEFCHIHDGLELADSYCFNPHKWLGVNFDCDCFYVADRATLIRTLSILPEYLRNQATEAGAVIDYRDWHVQLGRRFRALKLWFVLRCAGVEGLQELIRRHVALAQEFAAWVDADPNWERTAPTPLNLVCFRRRGSDALNQQIMDTVNASGKMFLTHTRLRDRFTLRLSVGGMLTERHHVQAAWDLLRSTARELEADQK